jgi:hypothetical protein
VLRIGEDDEVFACLGSDLAFDLLASGVGRDVARVVRQGVQDLDAALVRDHG